MFNVGRVLDPVDGSSVISHAGLWLLRDIGNLAGLTERVAAVLADKAHASGVSRREMKGRGIKVAIPFKSDQMTLQPAQSPPTE